MFKTKGIEKLKTAITEGFRRNGIDTSNLIFDEQLSYSTKKEEIDNTPPDEDDIKALINAIKSGKCLIFLGPEVNRIVRNKQKLPLPTHKELAKSLAKDCNYNNIDDDNLLKVAEYFIQTFYGDRNSLLENIRVKIGVDTSPSLILSVLSQLTTQEFVWSGLWEVGWGSLHTIQG